MTQPSNQCDLLVQTAGHQIGTALHQPLPSKWAQAKRAGMVAVILKVSLSLLLWTIGASAMDLRIAPVAANERHIRLNLRMDRAQIENLQRWVNAGHDRWCLDPRLVAAAALGRVSPELAEYESASLIEESVHSHSTKIVYSFHSLDGRTTYRVTLHRHLYLLRSAGSLRRIIWTPETVEIITIDRKD